MKTLKFLLVDDSDSTNFFNKMMIEKATCSTEIKIAKDGEEALNFLNSLYIPDLILLDINMPKMNGWEFMEALKQMEHQYQNIAIIVMLGAELSEEKKTYINAQSNIIGCLDKMINKDKLVNIIKSTPQIKTCEEVVV